MVNDFPTLRPEPVGTEHFPIYLTKRQAGLLLQKLTASDPFDGYHVSLPLLEQCVDLIRQSRQEQAVRDLKAQATREAAERAAEERVHGHTVRPRER